MKNHEMVELSDLSKEEMREVQGGGWRTVVGTVLCVASPFVCYAAHKIHEATKD